MRDGRYPIWWGGRAKVGSHAWWYEVAAWFGFLQRGDDLKPAKAANGPLATEENTP